jgi:hypothetical protein
MDGCTFIAKGSADKHLDGGHEQNEGTIFLTLKSKIYESQ